MSKTIIGLLFIIAGLLYGSLALDHVYDHTLGYLLEHHWINRPKIKTDKNSLQAQLGRKPTIIFYSSILIILGLFILWNRNS